MNRSIVKYTLIVVTLLLLLGAIGSISVTAFRVQEIVFIGDRIEATVNEKLLGGSTIIFPDGKIREQLLREYPVFEEIRITKKMPGTILIEPKFREGVAQLLTQGTAFLLDSRGFVIDIAPSNWNKASIFIDVPVVRLGYSVGDERVEHALSFIRLTKDVISIRSVKLSPDQSHLIASTDGTEIYFSWNSDETILASTLQSLIAGFRIKGITPRVIDIRFNKPLFY